jgi:excisionase family DNA binding protein
VQPSTPPAPAPAAPPRLLLTVDEAAEQLGIGRTTAWSLIRSGALESVQIGRLRRVHTDAVAAYAAHLATSHPAA